MLERLKRFFGVDGTEHRSEGEDGSHSAALATCALFLEMGRIDDTFTEEEMNTVLAILKDKYGLSADDVQALVEEADRELQESVDLWQFARVINDHYSIAQKEKLMEQLWQIVYVDGNMDRHEHYLMNKLSKLLRLTHKQLIDAKLKVLHP